MKGHTEKERKSIFERLMDFRKEKIGMAEADGIGFWTEEKEKGIFAEERIGTVFLPQENGQKFWEKEALRGEGLAEKKSSRREEQTAEGQEKKERRSSGTKLFFAERLREEQAEQAEKSGMGRAFWTEEVTGERAERQSIPIAPAAAEERKMPSVTEEQTAGEKREKAEKEERSEIDIERLMRQMTKRLWEERESCGRRLR